MKKSDGSLPEPTNHNVIILSGEFAGKEGICLGPTHGGLWAVSPNGDNRILALKFDSEFGILINRSQHAGEN